MSKPAGKDDGPANRSARRVLKRSPAEPSPDLEDVLQHGASLRQRRLLRNLRPMLPEILAAGILQCMIYSAFILNASRSDWNNLAIVCSVLFLLPFAVALALLGFRRQRNTFSIAIFVTFVCFNVAVAVLSGLRIPVSYSALLTAYPIATIAMIVANLRLHRSLEDRVALLDFPQAAQVAARLAGHVAVISDKTADIGAYDRLLIDTRTHHNPDWSTFLTKAYMVGVDVTPWFNFLELREGRVDVGAFDVSHLAYTPSQIYYSKAKRALDLIAVIVTAPITIAGVCSLALYPGPRWRAGDLRANRRGYGGRPFNMLKFRTMYHGRQGGATRTNDDRIIKGCRVLRRLRLDELPQLINIWRGEMSLVGPRPVAEYVAQASEAEEPKFIHRTMVLPGITGWAQVNSGYAGTTQEEINKLSYDLYYIKHLSFDLDVLIILSTISTVLFGRGAR
ncbi:sugar transferase [Nitratireductor aquibiodomus]|uniref:sugar transferase n=1 Tax=Nitratireductor aquibiodomus TaxID=204799 RepID=UPI0012DE1898|nr:sugar transferase [Nitratireductor aquibiodomus]